MINKTRQVAAENYFVIGDNKTGKTSYLAGKLKDTAAVLWVSMLKPAQVDFDNVTIVTESDMNDLIKDDDFKSYSHIVIDGTDLLTSIMAANIEIDGKDLRKLYGILAQRFMLLMQRLIKHGAAIHFTANTRSSEAGTPEIALNAAVLKIVVAMSEHVVYTSTGRSADGKVTYRVQEDSVKALGLKA